MIAIYAAIALVAFGAVIYVAIEFIDDETDEFGEW
jgi:hypothetical protein